MNEFIPYTPTILGPYSISLLIASFANILLENGSEISGPACLEQDANYLLHIYYNNEIEIVKPFTINANTSITKIVIDNLLVPMDTEEYEVKIKSFNGYSLGAFVPETDFSDPFTYKIVVTFLLNSEIILPGTISEEDTIFLSPSINKLIQPVAQNSIYKSAATNSLYIYTSAGWELFNLGGGSSISLDDVTNFCDIYSPYDDIPDNLKNKTITSDALWTILQNVIPFIYNWALLSSKPSYLASEITGLTDLINSTVSKDSPQFTTKLSIGNSTITESQLATVVNVLANIAPAAGVSY